MHLLLIFADFAKLPFHWPVETLAKT